MADDKNNSGDYNSGHYNSGHCNSGYYNSGHSNSVNYNSGNYNSGNRNSGDYNSGHRNSGHYNSGHYNSGHYNSGHYNSGFFNTNEPNVRMFNKDTNIKRSELNLPNWIFSLSLNIWIDESSMSDQEKKDNPKFFIIKGYLKTISYKDAWKNLWNSITKEQRKEVETLPNFDALIFEEITGIKINSKEDTKKAELLAKADELIQKANELKAQAENI